MPFLGLGFGSGLAPVAPGTFGTLVAVPFYLLLSLGGHTVYLAGLILVLVGGVSICDSTAKILNSHDHPAIVWDEIAGFLVTMAVVGVSTVNVIVGFILFRFFDIIKPWPIRWIDRRVHGGLGIMLDDIVAGAIAGILLFLINLSNPAGLFSV